MQNFFEQFAWAAERHAGRTAIEVQHKDHLDAFTYGRLREMAERTAAWLALIGIGPGERCAILADNDAHWCAAYLGILRRGAVAVPLDTAYKASQVETLLRDSGARVFFTTPKYPRHRPRGARRRRQRLPHRPAARPGRGDRQLRRHDWRPHAGAAPAGVSEPAGRRGGDPLHVGHDQRSQGRGPHARQPAGRTCGRFRGRPRGRARHDPWRAAAVPRAGADGQPAAAVLDWRARRVSRDREHHRAAARAGRAPA